MWNRLTAVRGDGERGDRAWGLTVGVGGRLNGAGKGGKARKTVIA